MRVLVSGYYGYENLGDEALLSAVIAGLSGHEITVLSGNPAATVEQHRVRAVHRYTGLLGALTRCNAVVFGGGGLLQDRTSSRSLAYYTTIIRLATLLKKSVVLVGQSLGPLSAAGERQVRRALAGVPLGVRDEASFALAMRLGLQPARTADLALSLPAPQGLHAADGPVIVVPRADQPEFNALLREFVYVAANASVPVRAVAFQPSDTRADIGIPIAPLRTVQEWWDVLQGASAVLSVRLHGTILAASAQIPSVALSYDPKVAGFAELAQVPWFSAETAAHDVFTAITRGRREPYAGRAKLVAEAKAGVAWLRQQLAHSAH